MYVSIVTIVQLATVDNRSTYVLINEKRKGGQFLHACPSSMLLLLLLWFDWSGRGRGRKLRRNKKVKKKKKVEKKTAKEKKMRKSVR